MTIFLRLLAENDKAAALTESCARVRQGTAEARCIEVAPDAFDAVPGKPFSYWATTFVRQLFIEHRSYAAHGWKAVNGLTTGDDFRFVRTHWEALTGNRLAKHSDIDVCDKRWVTYAKGGETSPYYARFPMILNWGNAGKEMKAFSGTIVRSEEYFLESGLTWPLRASKFGPQCRPRLSVFSVRGYSAIAQECELLFLLGLTNATLFDHLFKVSLGRHGFPEFVVGTLAKLPVPEALDIVRSRFASLARRAWSLKRSLDTVTETSHAFLLPLALRQAQGERLGTFDPPAIEAELARIQAEIDGIAFDLYGFSDADRAASLGDTGGEASDGDAADDADAEGDEDEAVDDTPSTDALLSWAVGVAFGRFDIRIATGERAAPPEPEPFDALPAKSPGMLPDGDAPFYAHAGILVADPGHAHDLVRIAERVLERVDMPVPAELRRWLQKEFFPFHLQRYSKSRRKAPIYWQLATGSGSYTLWLYYPSLTSQTLYTAINDFVEPKLAEVETEAAALRTKASARSRDEEKRLEALTTLEAELRDLRDQLQTIAPHYQPNHDDGVQITAAPLWPLFRHKPWQKLLKDTWAKLEKGDYDWAHLAMSYWPERVREKCRHDKSLAIAHGLEEIYVEPPAAPKKARGRKKENEA